MRWGHPRAAMLRTTVPAEKPTEATVLDDTERRILRETESHLARDDPALARLLRRGRRPTLVGSVVLVLGVALTIGLLWLGLTAQALVMGTMTALLVGRRHLRAALRQLADGP